MNLVTQPEECVCVCVWGGGVGLRTTMILHSQSLLFDMQRDHVLKELNFDLLTQSPGFGGFHGQNICCHVVVFLILDHVLKKLNF